MSVRQQPRSLQAIKYQSGVTLIELMIAMLIGLFVIGGMISLFSTTQQTYRQQEGLWRVQENGRFAIDIFTRDIREAGYFGCLGGYTPEAPRTNGAMANGLIRNTLNPAPPAAPAFGVDFTTSLVGFHGDPVSGTWSPALPTTPLIISPLAGSDILAISSITNTGLTVTAHPGTPANPGSANIQTTDNNGIVQGEILLVSDCQSGAIFQVTNANPNTSGSIVHNTGGVTSPGNWTTHLGRSFVDAEISRLQRSVYYVAADPDANDELTLFRNDTPLIEGVSRMLLLFGEDTDDDGVINRYVRADQVADMGNVLAVRVNLLVGSAAKENVVNQAQFLPPPFGDGVTTPTPDRRLYQVFSTTVAIRNRLP